MSNTPLPPHNWVVEEKINKEKLLQLAVELERQLEIDALRSNDVAAFARNAAVVSVIQRAKNMEIDGPEELGGMRYWLFETELGDLKFSNLGDALANFSFALKCWRLED
jgi:hypothetical protein